MLDINLQANPNILGTVVRTWRFLVLRRARLSKRLAVYLEAKTREFGIEKVLAYEIHSYHTSCMTKAKWHKNYASLVEYLGFDTDNLFELAPSVQASLFC